VILLHFIEIVRGLVLIDCGDVGLKDLDRTFGGEKSSYSKWD